MSGWHLPFGGPSIGWDEALAQQVEDALDEDNE